MLVYLQTISSERGINTLNTWEILRFFVCENGVAQTPSY